MSVGVEIGMNHGYGTACEIAEFARIVSPIAGGGLVAVADRGARPRDGRGWRCDAADGIVERVEGERPLLRAGRRLAGVLVTCRAARAAAEESSE